MLTKYMTQHKIHIENCSEYDLDKNDEQHLNI